MTKGHIHSIPSAEIYYGITGSGLVLQENETESLTIPIEEGVIVYCKPNYAHRLINTGNNELKVLCVCRADADHNYSWQFKRHILK